MFDSIIRDIRYELTRGNMVTKLILVSCGVFVVFLLAKVVTTSIAGGDPAVFNQMLSWFVLPGQFSKLLTQPWSLLTFSFIHLSIWQILFNMLLLYWFGQIAGDLIGDRRIFPIYVYGALFGGLFAVLVSTFLPGIRSGEHMIMGASAPVMAIIVAAATLAPDYLMRLILIGPVRIKFIVWVLLLIQVIGVTAGPHPGSSYAGIGGAITGFLFVVILRNGYDPSSVFRKRNREKIVKKRQANQKSKIISIFDTIKKHELEVRDRRPDYAEQRLDEILDKIKREGRSSLTRDELDFLEKMSKS